MKRTFALLVIGCLIGGFGTVALMRTRNKFSSLPNPVPIDSEIQRNQADESHSHLASNTGSGVSWPTVRGDSPSVLASQLQDIGCPEDLRKDILVAELNRRFSLNFRSYLQSYIAQYGSFCNSGTKPKTLYDQLLYERESDLFKVFGADISEDDATIGEPYKSFDPETAGLADKTIHAIANLKRQYAEQVDTVLKNSHGFLTKSDSERITELKRAEEEEIRKLLTPEEYYALKVKRRSTSPEFLNKYQNFEPTSDETVAIFKYEERIARLRQEPDQTAANKEMQAELLKVMSPERMQQVCRLGDPGYAETVALAKRFDLPNEAINQLSILKVETVRQYYNLMHSGPAGAPYPAEVEEALQALQLQVLSQVEGLLGKPAADAFRSDGKTSEWLR